MRIKPNYSQSQTQSKIDVKLHAKTEADYFNVMQYQNSLGYVIKSKRCIAKLAIEDDYCTRKLSFQFPAEHLIGKLVNCIKHDNYSLLIG